MKKHTKEFKSSISTFGRELDSKITVLGTELILEKEDLFSITPITNSTLLKTVMKEVDFESKKQIGIGQEINVKSGVKVNGEYEYIDYGNYSVYKSEYKAETDTYSHICYDKMLKTMIDYTPLDITYPINLREYINAIATKCGLEFADKNSTFANYNTSINEDHFSNGNYTFRDVLDYIAQLVGGWLCINDNDELEIRYPELAKNYDKVSGENVSFISNVEDEINTIIVDGKSTQATRSGKNLFDSSQIVNVSDYIVANGTGIKIIKTTNGRISPLYNISLKANTEYTISCNLTSTTTYPTMYCQWKTNDGSTLWAPNLPNGSTTFTPSKDIVGVIFYLQNTDTDGTYVELTNLQIEKGSTATDYEPYGVMPSPDYPSEIESVGTYFSFDEETGKYGIEVKNTGKNLLNNIASTTTIHGVTFTKNEDGSVICNGTATNTVNTYKIATTTLQPGTYTLSGCPSGGSTSTFRITELNGTIDDRGSGKTFTVSQETTYNWYIQIYNGNVCNNLIFKPMIRLSSIIDDTYEPYQESTSLFVLDQPLRSLPNGVKDIAYIKNGILYVDRKVGTVVLDGSENWAKEVNNAYITISNAKGNNTPTLSNYFKSVSTTTNVWGDIKFGATNKNLIFYKGIIENTDLAGFKTWLSTHNVEVLYELAEPYTETIGEVETLSTFKGINNVSLDTNIQTNMTITYPTEYEELDKHFLKDVNVSFSKKYGAVNSVVFSRGNGSDNIYRKDNASINKNGLTEIKIADNPFLEGDDRENFIQSLFNKINGLEFYIMDVASTGIMYLELGDFYYFNMVEEKPSLKSGLVKSGMRKAQGSSGGKFLCLLMNDETKITQGLEESIYNDEPEITETNYKTASITDTSIKNAIIQTNKNSAEILLKVNSDEVVSAINLSPEKIKISSAKLDIDAIATFTNSKLAEAGSTVINGANITTGSINCDRLNGGTINGQKISGSTISGGSISITKGVYYFNMGTATSNPNCSGLNVGEYGIKAHSDITATGFAITDSDTGKSQSVNIYDGHGHVHYLTFTGGILTKWEYK